MWCLQHAALSNVHGLLNKRLRHAYSVMQCNAVGDVRGFAPLAAFEVQNHEYVPFAACTVCDHYPVLLNIRDVVHIRCFINKYALLRPGVNVALVAISI